MISKAKFVVTVLMLFLAVGTHAQGLESLDIIRLNSGTVWKGKILSWENDGFVYLETLNGTTIPIPEASISRVRQKVIYPEVERAPRSYAFREQGLYHAVAFGVSVGTFAPGMNLSYAAGHRFSRWIGVGGGVGFGSFELDEGKNIIQVFSEARGFLTRTNVSPYYSVRLGYGFALKNDNNNITSAKGGIMFNPELGVRFGGGARVSYYLGMGIHLQRATHEYTWPFSEQRAVEKTLYKRWELKTGVVF